ncbi:hypothetical protein ACQKWADRAFT_139670 [Trichoderma austrokoningii]
MVDAWIFTCFSFLPSFSVHFFSFSYTAPLVQVATGLFFTTIVIIPLFLYGWSKHQLDYFQFFILPWLGDMCLMFFFISFFLIPKDTRDGMGLLRSCRDR